MLTRKTPMALLAALAVQQLGTNALAQTAELAEIKVTATREIDPTYNAPTATSATKIELEARLSVEDSPNSAGVAIDAIRCCKRARDRGLGGPLLGVSSYFMKHPPRQVSDDVARDEVERFIRGEGPG